MVFGKTQEEIKRILDLKEMRDSELEGILGNQGLEDFRLYQRMASDEYFDESEELVVQDESEGVMTLAEIGDELKGTNKEGLVDNPAFINFNDTCLLTADLDEKEKRESLRKHSIELLESWATLAKDGKFKIPVVGLKYWREDMPWVYNFDSAYDGAVIGVRNFSDARYVNGRCIIVGDTLTEEEMNKPLETRLARGTPKISRVGSALTGMAMMIVYQGLMMGLRDKDIGKIVKESFEKAHSALYGKKKRMGKLSSLAFDEMRDYMDGQLVDSPAYKNFVDVFLEKEYRRT